MKLAVLVAAAAQAKSSSWLKKEWEVQDAYFADEEIILSDLSVREGLKKIYDRVEASYLIINLKFWTIKDQSSNGTIVAINQRFQKMAKM